MDDDALPISRHPFVLLLGQKHHRRAMLRRAEEPMERQCGISMMAQRRGTPRWEDNPVWRRDGRCRLKGQETDSTLEGSLPLIGADMGYGKIDT